MDSNQRYLSPHCLTLNVLLSFAQFEREVTGERIRDKISASRKKGMWMGGVVPLGYRAEDRALHVVEDHAAIVRSLFAARPPRPRGRGRATPSRRGARPGASGGAQAGRVLLGDEAEIARRMLCNPDLAREALAAAFGARGKTAA